MFKRLEWLLAVVMLPLVAIMCFAPEYWVLSLFKSVAIQIMVAILLVTAYWMLKKKFKYVAIGVLSSLIIYAMIPPFFDLEPSCIPEKGGLRIAHFNVLKSNEDYLGTIKAAKSTQADFISFQEVNKEWQNALTESLADAYPYSFSLPLESCCFGIAVFSKHPLTDVESFYSGSLPNIRGNMIIDGTSVHFVTSHTSAPTSYNRYQQRNQHLSELATLLEKVTGPKVAIGDYNSVPWDSAITGFKQTTLLKDSRKTVTPTYPAYLKIASVPLDYIFHSQELTCVGFTSIEGTSSDHLGILGTYSLQL